jgi:tetratricopeptide (TPR) repeat protein
MNRWLIFLLVIGLLRHEQIVAQTHTIDSLRLLLKANTYPDTARLRQLRLLGRELLPSNLSQSITLLQEALVLSRKLSDLKSESNILISLGTTARLHANYTLARHYTHQAQLLFTRRKDWSGLAKSYLQLSLIESVPGNNLVAALQAALTGISFAEKANDFVTQTQLQYALGDIYFKLGDYKNALSALETTLKNGQKIDDKYVVAAALNLLGNIHRMLKNWPRALVYFQRAAIVNRALDDTQSANKLITCWPYGMAQPHYL